MNTPTRSSAALRARHTFTWDGITAAVRRIGAIAVGFLYEPGIRVASWSLSADLSSVPRARHLTRARLAAWGLEGYSDVVELLVSELVTNALSHARGPCLLRLSTLDGLLRCEVEDTSTELPLLRSHRAWDEGGRGLHLLDTLACCWGSIRMPTGKATWFELPTS